MVEDGADNAAEFSAAEWDTICLANLLAATEDHAYFKDLHSRFVRVSAGVVRAAGRPRAELRGLRVDSDKDLIGKTDYDLFTYERAHPAFEAEQQIIRTGAPIRGLIERQTWPDRPPSYVLTNKMPLRAPDGRVVGTFGFSRDVTDDLLVRRQLAAVLATCPDGISRLDLALRYVYVNPAARELIGRSDEQVVGKTDQELGRDPDFIELWLAALRRVLDSGTSTQLEHQSGEGAKIRHYDSRIVAETDDDVVTGILVFTRDITDRKRAELALAEQAVRDPLTGLANRALLLDRVGQSLVRLERAPGTLAVLFLDLDRFKVVNDSLGHAFGDALLVGVGERLNGIARRSDTVARFGGDEFVMLCDRVSAPEDARTIAERVTRELAVPFSIDGHVLHMTASVGISTSSDAGDEPGDLIRDADTAMYQAKERGRGSGRYQLFDANVRQRAVSRLEIENELRKGIEESQLRVYYQPMHVLSTGELHGVEALVRWQHPSRGMLLPADFLAVAEESNLIIALGEWVLDEACRQLASWNAARGALPPLTMAVNISARQLGSHQLVQTVSAALAKYALSPSLLCLEITETALLEEAVSSPEIFAALHKLGVLLALDDFGTGYSSLGHLRRFPVDILKIDQEFVGGLAADGTGDSAIVGAITALAHALGMTTVGEGVETQAQLELLKATGCDEGQGYLLAHPMPAGDLAALLGLPRT